MKSVKWFDINQGVLASSLRTNNVTSHLVSRMHDYRSDVRKDLGDLLLTPKTNVKFRDNKMDNTQGVTTPKLSRFRSPKEMALKIQK